MPPTVLVRRLPFRTIYNRLTLAGTTINLHVMLLGASIGLTAL
jgi:hypothetical protein